MDKMPCILFAHGGAACSRDFTAFSEICVGGYYFGSIDQERYSIERYARKINGRVFGMLLIPCTPRIIMPMRLCSHQLSARTTVSVPLCLTRLSLCM